MSLGYGATLVPTWFSYVFTYDGSNHAKKGFLDAIVLVLETGFAVTAFVAILLNLLLDEEVEEEEVESLVGDGDDVGESLEFREMGGGEGEGKEVRQGVSSSSAESAEAPKL